MQISLLLFCSCLCRTNALWAASMLPKSFSEAYTGGYRRFLGKKKVICSPALPKDTSKCTDDEVSSKRCMASPYSAESSWPLWHALKRKYRRWNSTTFEYECRIVDCQAKYGFVNNAANQGRRTERFYRFDSVCRKCVECFDGKVWTIIDYMHVFIAIHHSGSMQNHFLGRRH